MRLHSTSSHPVAENKTALAGSEVYEGAPSSVRSGQPMCTADHAFRLTHSQSSRKEPLIEQYA